jgi:hypothetical protein
MNKRTFVGKKEKYGYFWDGVISPYLISTRKRCEICKSKKRLLVHHTDYKNININTLQVICKKCHMKIHANLHSRGKK